MNRQIVVIAIALLTMGCFGSSVPLCSDDDVKKLVIDISTREIREQMIFPAMREFNLNPWGIPSYDEWNKIRDKDESVRKVLDLVDKWIAESKMTLAGIRTNAKHKESRKCECAGELTFSNGKTHSIKYTAQYTEDGQIYVAVSGLK